jgi:predicted alpha/beta-fold hydrolase
MSEPKHNYPPQAEFFNQPFAPPLGLQNPHSQTVFSSMGRKFLKAPWQADFVTQAEVREIQVAGVKLVVHSNFQSTNTEQTPLVMMIPGWLGNVASTYVLSGAHALWQSGFNVIRINLRDHGDTAHLNSGLFHSALIDEVVALVKSLMGEFPQAPTGLIGYSMGGNFALRIAKQIPELTTLAVCPALSPEGTMLKISGNIIYEQYFLRKWRNLWSKKQTAFPQHYNFSDAMNLSSITSLTDYFVKYHTEYDNTDDYFAAYDLSSGGLEGVTAKILAAEDDPIIPAKDYANLPDSISLDCVSRGGHGAFLENWQFESWCDRYSCAFFRHALTNERYPL